MTEIKNMTDAELKLQQQVSSLQRALEHAMQKKDYYDGRAEMKADIVAVIVPCLDRDPTLQKLVATIRAME